MIISDFYNTNISCSKYNVKINETITVTVELLDFNNEPVKNKEVKVDCSDGVYFTNDTGVTDNTGKVTFTLHTIDWGMQTIHCNNEMIMLNVRGGFKLVSINKNNNNIQSMDCKCTRDTVFFYIYITNAPTSTTPSLLATVVGENNLPYNSIGCPSDGKGDGQVWINSDGGIRCLFNSTSQWIGFQYPKRDSIRKY